ncbi:TIGR01212 family radical SAM protein [Bulleidia sp. zg-1006]|uniref:TIGR01212 family radical SAM protein n=1 Tax=Bulleidia sp. zg-1006 TaxID=2806552 RepID=UPI00193A16A4|nr:TIGR01212 family radical SAM protein [Bulleidia sp. zg-1006]QRG87246.1 TIGR01212 family radical SAM protein [Bulleidia sp. zg-1006]
MKMKTMSDYCQELFGTKVYRLSLSTGCTCPNRDGLIGYGGCTFCSERGAGEFASRPKDISSQIVEAKKKVEAKFPKSIAREKWKYIAYFQSFTNTYGDTKRLLSLFQEAIEKEEIVCLAIGTRPDCLQEDMLEGLEALNKIKPVWIELGLQTIHEESAKAFHRGYSLDVFEKAYVDLKKIGMTVIVHMIVGLPFETEEMMYASMRYLSDLKPSLDGIKIHGLHLLKGTQMALEYEEHPFHIFSLEEYTAVLIQCLKILPETCVIHRMTGDGDKKNLIEPKWSANKRHVLNYIQQEIRKASR